MVKVKLGDVSEKESSNLSQKDIEGMGGNYPIYGASGYIGNVDFYHQEKDYVAVVKDGAGIGRTVFLPAKSSVNIILEQQSRIFIIKIIRRRVSGCQIYMSSKKLLIF